MLRTKSEIKREIDKTLDRILENDHVLKAIADDPTYQEEEMLLRKTQESLLAHLLHMDEMLKKRTTAQPLQARAITRRLSKLSTQSPAPKARPKKAKQKALVSR